MIFISGNKHRAKCQSKNSNRLHRGLTQDWRLASSTFDFYSIIALSRCVNRTVLITCNETKHGYGTSSIRLIL
jgi:hypothetical protein